MVAKLATVKVGDNVKLHLKDYELYCMIRYHDLCPIVSSKI